MTKHILKIGIVVFSILTTSCNKWLDLSPQDGITKQEFWKTKEDVKAALNGIYSSIIDGGVEQRILIWGEIRADMVEVTNLASEDLKQIRNSNILSTNGVSDWSALYRVINNCNLLIDFAGEAKRLDPTFSDLLYNSYVGEALTLRSLMYFYLVRSFRDVPLKLNGSYKDNDIKELGKSTDKVIIAQIIKDLIEADKLVPQKHGNNNAINKGRVTNYAVNALLADVYLWNEEYDNAIAAADKVLINSEYSLINASGGWFESVFENGSSSETILEFNHRESVSNSLYNLLVPSNRTLTISEFLNSEIFIPNSTVDVELSDGRGSNFYNGTGTITKYGTDNPSFYNFQVYRVSDVMLIKAESLNQVNRHSEALNIVKNIRDNREAIEATNLQINDDDKGGIDQFILEERAREFAFEGKRWFDLLRNAKRDNYSNLNILIELITRITDSSVQQSAVNKIRDLDSHYFPISEGELFSDTKLVQNPFYIK